MLLLYLPDDLPRFNGLDIALVTLSKSFLLSEYVKPICMPYNTKLTKIKAIDEKWDGEPLTITGFGIKDDPEKLPDRLLYANVVKIKSEQCLKSPNTLFRNKGFLVNLKTKRYASKFAMFMEKENPCSFFVFHLEQLLSFPYECPGLCQYRPGNS